MTARVRLSAIAFTMSLLATLCAAGGPPFPTGDYGDAPDCPGVWQGFPTRYDTDHGRFGWPGAHHLIVGEESMRLVSAEQGAMDPFDPDGVPNLGACPGGPVDADAHDDGVRFTDAMPYFEPFVTTPHAVWTAAVVITIAATAPPGPRYLNVVSDVDGDGRWKNNMFETEWVVRNARFDVLPGTSEVHVVTLGVHPFGKGRVWTRFTLTRDPIPLDVVSLDAGWDGSGEFQYGETEDYLVDAGAPIDPSAVAPTYNLDIPAPPPCRYFFGTNCEPETAGNCSPLNAIPHGTPGSIAFRVRARSHPLNPPGSCEVRWDQEQRSLPANPPIRGINPHDGSIDDTDIDNPVDELGASITYPPPTTLMSVDPTGVTKHIIYNVHSLTDGPERFESRRIQNDFVFVCCGGPPILKQESCALAIAHDGGFLGGDWPFGIGLGSIHDLGLQFGFDFSSPETTGHVTSKLYTPVDLSPGDIPYLQAPYLHKLWVLMGTVDPLEGQDDPPSTTKITAYRFDFTDNDLLAAAITPAQKSQLVVGRLDAANLGNKKWSLDVGDSESVDAAQNFISVVHPKSFGQWAIGLPASFLPQNAGVVSSTVRVNKAAGGAIRLSWSPSCANETVDYAIYQGVIGSWTSHTQLACSDVSHDLQETVVPGAGNRYYLVVPLSADVEGSYGTRSSGLERSRGLSTCRAIQLPGACPVAAAKISPLTSVGKRIIADVAVSP